MMTLITECISVRKEFQQRLARDIEECDKTQVEIAHALGYTNANIVAMFKNGKTRLPPDKVAPLALVIGRAPAQMLREWFKAYMPQVLADIDDYMLDRAV